jgi:putative SOS response-associated peptidase YedK
MCGRFTLRFDLDRLLNSWDIDQANLEWQSRWNVSPGQNIPVFVCDSTKGNRLGLLQWGLIPRWHSTNKPVKPLVNGKRETAHEKASFRHLLARNRCVIPADGWYEWRADDSAKQPYWFHHPEQPILAFAGLYDRWVGPDAVVKHTCTLLTMEAIPSLAHIHHRMPLLLDHREREVWATVESENADIRSILTRPAPDWTNRLQTKAVSKAVNSSRHDHAGLWEEEQPLWT